MIVLQDIKTSLLKLVKINSTADTCYRLSNYSITIEVDEGLLIYNTLTCGMVILNPNEVEMLTEQHYLKEKLFVVPDYFEEKKAYEKLVALNRMLRKPSKGITDYTILTTTDCNARCFYCYEMGRSRIPMTRTTALKVAEYILANWKKYEEGKRPEINIRWFGGEPLYNAEVIDIICSRLAENVCKYKSSMVSNAYLFDDKMILKAKEWNLTNVQITLDGTERIYNRSKAFVYNEGSAYQRVMDNIGKLLDAGIMVIVRLNIDMHNADDLKQLAGILAERFGGYKKFSCYSRPLYENMGQTPLSRTDERRSLVYKKQAELKTLLKEHKLYKPGKLRSEMKFNRCMSDSDTSVVIAPTGDIGKCEHYSDNGFFSHIDSPDKVDSEQIRKFAERCEDLPICADCPLYPQCIRLKVCESGTMCFKELKADRIEELKASMLRRYEVWKTSVKEKCDAQHDV